MEDSVGHFRRQQRSVRFVTSAFTVPPVMWPPVRAVRPPEVCRTRKTWQYLTH